MCSGTIERIGDTSVVKCDYCGSLNTIPKVVDDNTTNLFNRANSLRIRCEFDLAEKIYEKIIESGSKDPEAYWGMVLCQFGIEYVDDPKNGEKIPTCHRTSLEAVSTNYNYQQAIMYADVVQRPVYQEEARVIDAIQKEILKISSREAPFDVFICYKETDNNNRTQDSVIANDIYYQLTQEGYKVFYAAITLEDKLGQDYEPIIFSALNSAKVMLVIGTKPEYFNSVWVKNEWSRFLKMMKSDRSKQLYPCYRNIDPYELPSEFSHLQAQDMSKIGFINDLVRGIKKVIVKNDELKEKKSENSMQNNSNDKVTPIIKRAFIFLEDCDYENANVYLEKALDINPECAIAYLGKLMIELKVSKIENLGNLSQPFDTNSSFKKAYRYADEELKKELDGYNEKISKRIEENELNRKYQEAVNCMSTAKTDEDFNKAKLLFSTIASWKDSSAKAKFCFEKSEELRLNKIYDKAIDFINQKDEEQIKKAVPLLESIVDWRDSKEVLAKIPELCKISRNDKIYDEAIKKYKTADIEQIMLAVEQFRTISDWRDSKNKIQDCLSKIENLEIERQKAKENAEKITRENEAKRKKRSKILKRTILIACAVTIIISLLLTLTFTAIVPSIKIKKADDLVLSESIDNALLIYDNLENYKNAKAKKNILKNVKLMRQEVMSAKFRDYVLTFLSNDAAVTIEYVLKGGNVGEKSDLNIDQYLDLISERMRDSINETLGEYGLFMPEFFITSISFPDDDPNFVRLKQQYADKSLNIREETIKAAQAKARQERLIIEHETAAKIQSIDMASNVEKIKAEAEANAYAYRVKSMAESDDMKAKGYSYVDETARKVSIGAVQKSDNSLMNDAVSLGVTLGTVGVVSSLTKDIIAPIVEDITGKNDLSSKSQLWNCPNCGRKDISTKFCPDCGCERK